MHKDYFPRKANALEGIILVRKNITTTLRNYSTIIYMHFAFIKVSTLNSLINVYPRLSVYSENLGIDTQRVAP